MKFSGVLGHDREIEILKRSISSGRVAHAYLFMGPEGVGKRLTAEAFASALNCENYDGDSCGSCRACRTIDEKTNVNIITLSPETGESAEESDEASEKKKKARKRQGGGTIKIASVRELQKTLRYRAESGRVVAIIDGADTIRKDASNVFLKTLEEPPEGAVIILVTSRPFLLLPTIHSRCQRISFSALKEDVVARIVGREKGASAAIASSAARYGGGSALGAMKALDTGMLEKRKEFAERLSNMHGSGAAAVIDFAKSLSKDEDLMEYLEFMKCWYRDAIAVACGNGDLAVNADMAGALKETSGKTGIKALVRSYAMVEEARIRLMPPNYDSAELTLEALFAGLLSETGGYGRRI